MAWYTIFHKGVYLNDNLAFFLVFNDPFTFHFSFRISIISSPFLFLFSFQFFVIVIFYPLSPCLSCSHIIIRCIEKNNKYRFFLICKIETLKKREKGYSNRMKETKSREEFGIKKKGKRAIRRYIYSCIYVRCSFLCVFDIFYKQNIKWRVIGCL